MVLQQLGAIVGEVVQHFDGAAGERHDRHQVGRLHLGLDEFLRGGEGAQLVGHRHRAHVEVDREEAAVAVADVAGLFGRDHGRLNHGVGGGGDGGSRIGGSGRRQRSGIRCSFWNSQN